MSFTFLLTGGNVIARAVADIQRTVERHSVIAMRRTVQGGASIVRGKASGTPGPRVITGDYRRSISGQVIETGPRVLGQIGTNAAQGRRLEFGFFGPDSLGRVFAQRPRPHFQPSVGEVGELAVRETTSELQRGLAA